MQAATTTAKAAHHPGRNQGVCGRRRADRLSARAAGAVELLRGTVSENPPSREDTLMSIHKCIKIVCVCVCGIICKTKKLETS